MKDVLSSTSQRCYAKKSHCFECQLYQNYYSYVVYSLYIIISYSCFICVIFKVGITTDVDIRDDMVKSSFMDTSTYRFHPTSLASWDSIVSCSFHKSCTVIFTHNWLQAYIIDIMPYHNAMLEFIQCMSDSSRKL